MRWLGFALITGLGLHAACGGKAIIDPPLDNYDDGAGGTTTTTTTQTSNAVVTGVTTTAPSVATSTTSGMPSRCDTIESCCFELCDYVVTTDCWDPGQPCECDGIGGFGPECDDVFAKWYNCLVSNIPDSLVCSNGELLPACGVCDEEAEAVEVVCGFGFPPCG